MKRVVTSLACHFHSSYTPYSIVELRIWRTGHRVYVEPTRIARHIWEATKDGIHYAVDDPLRTTLVDTDFNLPERIKKHNSTI